MNLNPHPESAGCGTQLSGVGWKVSEASAEMSTVRHLKYYFKFRCLVINFALFEYHLCAKEWDFPPKTTLYSNEWSADERRELRSNACVRGCCALLLERSNAKLVKLDHT
jgi:hypothetical protein